MPRRLPRPRLILRAALTVDGKLDDDAPPPSADDDPAVLVIRDATTLAADPAGTLAKLPAEVRRVICLGPAEAFRALLDAGRVDELELTVLPHIDGRRDAATLGGPPGAAFFPASVACRLLAVETRENRCLLRYRVLRPAALKAGRA